MSILRKRVWMVAAAWVALAPVAAAGPVQDFERQLSNAYAHYRAALMYTNLKNAEQTQAAIAAFEAGWAGILARKSDPPPHYVGDTKWGKTLDDVSAVLAQAKSEAAQGDLARSHQTLEDIRYLIAEMRRRNGIVSFSDHMNAYHEQMERVVGGSYGNDSDGLGRLREDVAVLAYLAAELDRLKPDEFAQDEAFKKGLADLAASVAALQSAVRSGDTARLGALRNALKPAYSRIFMRYG